jgi:hypothetical protein
LESQSVLKKLLSRLAPKPQAPQPSQFQLMKEALQPSGARKTLPQAFTQRPKVERKPK